MAKILAISSEVVRGHVGNTAARLALQCLGHEVWALPTVILSNHVGHAKVAGLRLEPKLLDEMLEALASNGWIGEIEAVMTGYLPSADHVVLAAEWIARLKRARPRLHVLCDPVLGDDPMGLYVQEDAAVAVRTHLLPIADLITPNRFELAWLTGHDVADRHSARAAARTLPVATVIGTSIPVPGKRELENVLAGTGQTLIARVPKADGPPHGTGDLFAALYLGHVLAGRTPAEALGRAVGGVKAALESSAGLDEMRLAPSHQAWGEAVPWPVTTLGEDG